MQHLVRTVPVSSQAKCNKRCESSQGIPTAKYNVWCDCNWFVTLKNNIWCELPQVFPKKKPHLVRKTLGKSPLNTTFGAIYSLEILVKCNIWCEPSRWKPRIKTTFSAIYPP